MRRALASLFVGIAGGLVSSGLLLMLSGPPLTKAGWMLTAAVAIVSFSIGLAATRDTKLLTETTVASNLRSGRDIAIADVDVQSDSSTPGVRIASGLDAGRDISVRDVRVSNPSSRDRRE